MVLSLLRQIGCIYRIGKTDDDDPCDGGRRGHHPTQLSKAQIDNYSEGATWPQRCPDAAQTYRAFDGNTSDRSGPPVCGGILFIFKLVGGRGTSETWNEVRYEGRRATTAAAADE